MTRLARAAKQDAEVIMRIALTGLIGVIVGTTGCTARVIDLGDGDGGAGALSAGNTTDASTTAVTPQTCTSADGVSATLGSGYRARYPYECFAPRGPQAALGSATEMAALVAGLWFDCSYAGLGIDVGTVGDVAVELTSDGHYVFYGSDTGDTLAPLASLPGDPETHAASGASAAAAGTYSVVDGSATHGPGTYELQLRPANGGLFTGQVFVTTAPLQLHFFPPNGNEQILSPPMPWSPRKGVCSCISTSEAPEYEDDAAHLSSAIVGKWMWCDYLAGPGNIGIEFGAGNTWYGLDEDVNGNVTRSTRPRTQGTFNVVPTQPGPYVGTWPLTFELFDGSDSFESIQLLYFPSPRVLLVGGGVRDNGTGPMNSYVTSMPIP